MAKVVILSNTDGYYALAKKSLNSLRKDNILKDEGAAYLVTEGCLWDCYWEQLLEGSEVVIIEWMGVTLETPYLQGALDYLKREISHLRSMPVAKQRAMPAIFLKPMIMF